MKDFYKIAVCMLALIIASACSTGPKPIDYGNDGCHFCKMTIVDKIHGAELITSKGKVFKFDATECMLHYMADNKELEVSSVLTNYYETPTELVAVEEATFLISKKLPSPMGAYLTAFQLETTAEKMRLEKEGELYTWESLKVHLGY